MGQEKYPKSDITHLFSCDARRESDHIVLLRWFGSAQSEILKENSVFGMYSDEVRMARYMACKRAMARGRRYSGSSSVVERM
jgi:hypothetical protein